MVFYLVKGTVCDALKNNSIYESLILRLPWWLMGRKWGDKHITTSMQSCMYVCTYVVYLHHYKHHLKRPKRPGSLLLPKIEMKHRVKLEKSFFSQVSVVRHSSH